MTSKDFIYKKAITLNPGDIVLLPGFREHTLLLSKFSYKNLLTKEEKFLTSSPYIVFKFITHNKYIKNKRPKTISIEKHQAVALFKGHDDVFDCPLICCMNFSKDALANYRKSK